MKALVTTASSLLLDTVNSEEFVYSFTPSPGQDVALTLTCNPHNASKFTSTKLPVAVRHREDTQFKPNNIVDGAFS